MGDEIKKAIETYNKFAKIYADYTAHKLLQFQLNKFISLLPKKANVLDAGCGAGRDVSYLLEEGLDVIGIDIAEKLLEEAKQRVKEGKFLKMDLLNLEFPDKNFDGIWCMATLADFEKKDASKVLTNFNKILKDKGIIYIAVKEGEGEQIIKKEKYNNEPRFYAFYKEDELNKLLKENGFKVIESMVSYDGNNAWVEIFAKKIS